MGTLQIASTLVWGLLTSRITLIGFGGGIGSAARYIIGRAIHENGWTHHFPLGTFVVNFLGSLLLGFLMGLLWERKPDSAAGGRPSKGRRQRSVDCRLAMRARNSRIEGHRFSFSGSMQAWIAADRSG